jgi:hypothetical protein
MELHSLSQHNFIKRLIENGSLYSSFSFPSLNAPEIDLFHYQAF